MSAALTVGTNQAPASNDISPRETMWRRWEGDEWAAFEALPTAARRRIQEHAYDAWSVNALMLWRTFRRQTGSSARAERRLLRYLDECEAMERAAANAEYRQAYGIPLPHVAAAISVLRTRR
jgi:hypothetical protein